MKSVYISLIFIACIARGDDTRGVGDSRAASGGARPPQANEGFIGRDVPQFDPGSDTVAYDGKLWNVNNNRLFRARFEKYLNAPAATDVADLDYATTIDKIMSLLAPGTATPANQDAAFILLKKASEYRDDAKLCTILSDALYASEKGIETANSLRRENFELEKLLDISERNSGIAATSSSLGQAHAQKDDVFGQENLRIGRDAKLATSKRKVSEIGQTIANNKLRIAALELSAKGYLQALIMQFFATRRFQHVIIANRFYRALYTDGDNSIDVFKRMVDGLPLNKDAGQAKFVGEFNPIISAEGKGAAEVGGQTGVGGQNGAGVNGGASGSVAPASQSFSAQGVKLGVSNMSVESMVGGAASAAQAVSKLINSLSQLDGLASEAIRDVNEGVEAYKFLLANNELKSATERLGETFAIGEFMPSVRLLSRDDKRRVLAFSQKSNELLAALEVNDLTRAEKLVGETEKLAGDFDSSKPLAKIETAKTMSAMHLAKARNAAGSGDNDVMEAELRAAAEIWPRNPALAEVSGKIFSQGDVQNLAITDFEQLFSQKNYRQIFDDKMRFIAACAMFPEKQEQLRKILDDMAGLEMAIVRAQEVEKRGDFSGAWESVESAAKKFPNDNKLNQIRADLTAKSANFVRAVKRAEELESLNQIGSALAWYLKAQKDYPPSDFAKAGIERISRQIFPDI